ncbi:hypothetical protein F5Y03DRAFT_394867 [Xylaria venustula]|nr:hypothetical protein F5Y03DRAFT_394867 [Xylaria venustula]
MADKETTGSNNGDAGLHLTPAESKFFAMVIKYMPKNVELNWEELAREMNLKDGGIAKVRMRQIRKKHNLDIADINNANGTAQATKPNNAANKVNKRQSGKAGKASKAKQHKDAVEVAADAINAGNAVGSDKMDTDLHDGEI